MCVCVCVCDELFVFSRPIGSKRKPRYDRSVELNHANKARKGRWKSRIYRMRRSQRQNVENSGKKLTYSIVKKAVSDVIERSLPNAILIRSY